MLLCIQLVRNNTAAAVRSFRLLIIAVGQMYNNKETREQDFPELQQNQYFRKTKNEETIYRSFWKVYSASRLVSADKCYY